MTQTPTSLETSVADLVDRARDLVATGERRILGIVGPPGAGKSTLSAALLAALGDDVVLVPMDGFHLANEELERLGRRTRKGSPDTFDADGYTALLSRLRTQQVPVIYAPIYDRGLSVSKGSAIPVHVETPLVITEGNYLLIDSMGWEGVHGLLDETWFLEVPLTERSDRLVRRRMSFGHEPAASADWVRDVDTPNADLVETTRHRADLVINLLPDVN